MKNISKVFICFLGLVGMCALASCDKTVGESIKVYTRDTTSGTRDGFFTTIDFSEVKENNTGLVEGFVEVSSNGDMISSIKNDEYAIGYISLATLEESGLKGLAYQNTVPTEANVLNGSYKLTRNFNYITRAEYLSEDEKLICEAFIAYMNTKDGKSTIKSKDGIIEIASTDPSWNDIKGNYPICSNDNSNITIKFGGSTSVEKMAKAIGAEFASKCGNFKIVQSHTGSGDAFKRTQGSERDGSNALHIAFASREFKSDETYLAGTTGKMCVDAIVTVVNTKNSISQVTAESLKNIYSGKITKWSDIE